MNASDVLVIGSGAVGAAIAYFCALRGLSVAVVDSGAVGSGTSSKCEGNLLVSDKEHGPELDLANYSLKLWQGELAEHSHLWEFENKGGIIVASQESSMASLQRALRVQREHGIRVEEIDVAELKRYEPNVTDEAVGAAFYPDDSQVMPMLVTAHLMRMASEAGAHMWPYTEVTGLLRSGDEVRGVITARGSFWADAVINAAGPWGGQLARLAGVNVPVEPRRGYVLVTEPMEPKIFRKVYAAEYIDNVGSSDGGLQASPVVEGTPAGSVLIGSSRERGGFDTTFNPEAIGRIATNAVKLFPFLAETRVLRYYFGFRPYVPDHVPVIGPDPRAPGLWHACGHEGAGIGLSVGTGKIISQAVAGEDTDLSLEVFSPTRFGELTEVAA
ncbi:NAD(P)/FAD-dependent oxidoreductase [Nesterenkonia ebinurensis]|uniref:NAD(P)/FAD-dependent oxidoreductase n=1 Tax=Nesterenkonia ebinurensis TaxID=2608252 RepID=UPI001CC61185|nr:FAD-dependent oxidoreductase [Nesterenkonia ebinurensis]